MNDAIISEVMRTIEIEANAIKVLMNSIDVDAVQKTVEAISKSRHGHMFIISGCGTSAMAAKKACSFLELYWMPNRFF